MFQIRYRIVDDLSELKELSEEAIKSYFGIGGYVEILFCEEQYGFYYDGALWEDDCGNEDVDYWMEKLLQVVLCLIDGATYAAFSLIETYDTCLEFRKYGNRISINSASCEGKFSQTLFIFGKNQYSLPEDVVNHTVSFQEFQNVVLSASCRFLQDVTTIEPLTSKLMSIQEIERLVRVVKEKASSGKKRTD